MAELLEWNHFIGTLSASLGLEEEELEEGTHLYDDIGIDSLGIFSLGMKLIKVYGVNLPLSEVSTIGTVKDLYDVLEKYLNT